MNKQDRRRRKITKIWSKIKSLGKVSLRAKRTNQHIYAEILSADGKILAVASSLELAAIKSSDKKAAKSKSGFAQTEASQVTPAKKITKKEQALKVGELIATKAIALGLKQLAFNRNGYKFHGRIAAVALGARTGGLEF